MNCFILAIFYFQKEYKHVPYTLHPNQRFMYFLRSGGSILFILTSRLCTLRQHHLPTTTRCSSSKCKNGRPLPPVVKDVYSGRLLHSKRNISVEHIIPRKFFIKDHADDPRNIAFCDRTINSYRSDLKLGEQDYNDATDWDIVTVPLPYGGEINNKKRVYYPSGLADKGLLARSIIRMLFRYPYLYSYLDEIIDTPETLAQWSSHYADKSPYEKWRDALINRS